jgi:two-component system, chemotaxis family, CheB/CheR fusion protein
VSSDPTAASKDPESIPVRFRVVGIGASAGGLESLEQFFSNLPPNPGMAFVVVQHLSPDFRSVMDELLARHSDLPIQQAEDNIEVEANRVYLLPPKKEMIIRERRLLLTDKERTHGLTLPIDHFFRSLAQDVGTEAVGIILSGTGSDGSRGLREIKRAGGRVYVENPDSAKFDGMPLSALATGVVDQSAPASDIPQLLMSDANLPSADAVEPDLFLDETPMESIFRLLRDQFGLDFSLYKMTTVSRRILRRIELLGSVDLAGYAERLRVDSEELSSLYRDLLIGVTRFFRDPEAFDFLEQHVVPEILDRVQESEEIRIWIAACATGEEAYSIAMILYEQLTARGRNLNVKILSTDVHTASLTYAGAGSYGEEQLEHVNEKRRERFFRRKGNGYQISQDLRQLIVFAPHNITKDAPFTKMHLITCRNLLIYLEPPAQKSVLSLFHFGLVTGGFLFLGSSETAGTLASEFDTVNEHWKIYRKRRDVRLLEPLRMPVSKKTPGSSKLFLGHSRAALADTQLLTVYDELLNRHMPPSFLVDEDRHLVDSFGGAEHLFKIGKRRPSISILDLLDGDLRTVVAGAIQRALKNDGHVRYTGVPIGDGDRIRRCILSAEAFTNPRTNSTHVLITILDETSQERRHALSNASDLTTAQAAQDRMNTLESELSYTRETLQSTIEELQTANEELQATNEELVASNEELQSTNEELHSVNEELYTVNAELQRKITELRELNSDMQHFLESTDVGTLFLDGNLRIRKYTPRIASVFHIQTQDIGRSIRHFSHSLQRPTLLRDIELALTEGVTIEDEVRDVEDTAFFLRILPYRAASAGDGERNLPMAEPARVEGVVLSLTDISALERVRSRLRQLSAIVESSEDAIISQSLDGSITTWNRGAERLYGYSAEEVIGRNIVMLIAGGSDDQVAALLESIRRGGRIEHADTFRLRKDGGLLEVSVTISPIHDVDGRISGASAIVRDVAPVKKAQREVMEREGQIRLLLDSTEEGIIGLGPDGSCTFVNPSCVRMLGYTSANDLIGTHIHMLIHTRGAIGDMHAAEDCPLYQVLLTGKGAHSDNEPMYRADGTRFTSEYWSYPIRRGHNVVGAVMTFLDITERKQAEAEIRTAARRREEFLAMLSHELRNPLAAVVSAAKVMRTENISPHALDRARQIVERQSRQMARLLDDLLDVSRITRGGIELRKEDIDLREVVRIAIEALAPMLEERQSKLTLNLPDEVLAVRGDTARIQQVVANLVSNAARYSPPGSPIQLTIDSEAESLVLRVKDEGRGISPSMLSDIFEMFVQDEQGLERSTGGLGIGLTLVRQIVELHGGQVEAHSQGIGRGSEFVVRLPRIPHAVIHRGLESKRSADARRVLIVEDQDDSREMLRILLESMGHSVVEQSDGRSAVEAILREHPDVAIIDIGLPVMSGYDVARRVRENQLLDDVVLIALTGYGRDTDIDAAKAAGFDAHLTKPAETHTIDEILSRRARRQKAS